MIGGLLTVVGDTIQRVNSAKPPGARPKLSSSSDVLSKGEQGEKEFGSPKRGRRRKDTESKEKEIRCLKRLERDGRESSMMRRSHNTSRIARFGKVAGRATSFPVGASGS